MTARPTPQQEFSDRPRLPPAIEELATAARAAAKRTAYARRDFWQAVRAGETAEADQLEARLEAVEKAERAAWRKARRADIETGQQRTSA